MQVIDALLERHSARQLRDPAPDAGSLALLFESAVRAPDHGRLRPWRFVLIQASGRAALGELFADFLLRSKGAAAATEEALERERKKAFRAPAVIVVAASIVNIAKIPPIEQILSAGAAAHAILLAARALGFNAVWKTGGAAYDPAVKAALGFETTDAIVGFLYVGTDEEAEAEPSRRADWQKFVRSWG
jgi:nitroreductase